MTYAKIRKVSKTLITRKMPKKPTVKKDPLLAEIRKIGRDISAIRTSVSLLLAGDALMRSVDENDANDGPASPAEVPAANLETHRKLVTFPRMNLREIFEQSGGKCVNGDPLVWNFEDSWMRQEKFFDGEYTSPGDKAVDFRIVGAGKDWNGCADLAGSEGKRMPNFAELFWLFWKYPADCRELLKYDNDVCYSWVSTKPVRGYLGFAGYWDSSGPGACWRDATSADSHLGLGFSCTDL